ncbi:ABC transporter substrate-binding protein [Paracoccus denitrificans]|jgi:iron complex transport system substrate-binding protein|uniref:Periplasmic binding protein n=1 Tax=Paracoccus denitrificans (strain Pd 1222) TaxID=318586 RepID=A1B1R9_PARDP|nr:ABC transporter substrate-binding protein [Paracoccus denitrificans]ABL69463.1 periplasmic binding protein [Paracoccus denitrificans PD1222]MBB4626711.1 iron complex transport system substrate-binding protein [Paracoccus denitrificans]MCU7427803.1 ABC transporter substrate-binding protein [Paracoccus denitrificans]QAR25057.1 ABC transporter substrate-binding protein [Paracoccus denitrificans]UPV93761.1 ABC transporter substrate-binding protein [Paracoccus denitrificans]
MLRLTTALVATFALAPMALAGTEYPLTLTSCGHEVTFEAAPESVVSVGQSTTEILYMLGLGDKVAGTALWINPVLPEFAEVDAKVERLSDNAPSFESVLAKKPGLVVTAYEWMIGPQGAIGTREMFDDAQIPSWIMPTECIGKDNTQSMDGARTVMFDTALLYQGIEELATIFDVQDRGAEVIADLKAREAAAVEKAQGLNLPQDVSGLFWYSSADIEIDPYVAGVNAAPGWMLSKLGVRNVITSQEEWPTVGWETIAKADPSFIVAAEMNRRRFPADDIAVKREFLTSDPVTAEMEAVKNDRILTMPANAMDPSVRTIYALESLADSLAGFDLK